MVEAGRQYPGIRENGTKVVTLIFIFNNFDFYRPQRRAIFH